MNILYPQWQGGGLNNATTTNKMKFFTISAPIP